MNLLSMMLRWNLDAVLVWIYLSIPVSLSSESPINKVFHNPNSPYDFTHLCAYDSDEIIIGGTNYIHRVFAGNLSLQTSQKIGPKLDNPNCFYSEDSTCKKKMYNSYVKVLLVNKREQPNQDELIICTSLYQGTCEKRNLSSLELLPSSGPKEKPRRPIVANNKTATTIAFLAPGPSSDGSSQSTALYVGASWTNTGLRAIRSLLPAFSSRNILDFDFTYNDLLTSSSTMTDEVVRDSFPIRYVYGFASRNFSYLATIQKSSVQTNDYVSKLIRVCQFDRRFYSYAEASLRCEDNGKLYNLLQTAYLSKPGSYLARALGIPKDEDVLFGMFGFGNPDKPVTKDRRSVMCIFPSRLIRRVFSRNIRKCFDGNGKTGPDHIVSPRNCKRSVKIEAPGIAEEYSEVTLDAGMPITRYTFTDYDRQHLYVLTPRKLIKMKVETCTQYVVCDNCIRDPYCTWDTQKIKCMSSDNVSSTDALVGTCPSISSLNKTGTNNIPTLLIISVANLQQLREGQYACSYNGYGEKMTTTAERIEDNQIQCSIPWEELPPFPLHRGCIRMKLSVLLDGTPIAFEQIDFFECEVTNTSCSTKNCTVDGFWSSFGPFSEWSTCSQTCGGGQQNRTQYRTCTDPPKSEGGNVCEGPEHNTETRQCNEQDCPVYGAWTEFQGVQNWSQCSVSCGEGNKVV
ncbi:plexin-A1-like isoform X2 [Ostrea edulis]|uniref:plexin-A1-like isoform X2 n=1 Tax=Ostrea edulis TaxID=37623 RepID=UPI0020948B09|nr:plexin-A1-like isoform X2 [Ostrea edulis]